MAEVKTTPTKPNEFPVKVLKFLPNVMIEFANFKGTSAIKSNRDETAKQERFVVTYVPQMRHHRVEYYAPSAAGITSTHNVWEGHVGSWEAE